VQPFILGLEGGHFAFQTTSVIVIGGINLFNELLVGLFSFQEQFPQVSDSVELLVPCSLFVAQLVAQVIMLGTNVSGFSVSSSVLPFQGIQILLQVLEVSLQSRPAILSTDTAVGFLCEFPLKLVDLSLQSAAVGFGCRLALLERFGSFLGTLEFSTKLTNFIGKLGIVAIGFFDLLFVIRVFSSSLTSILLGFVFSNLSGTQLHAQLIDLILELSDLFGRCGVLG